jgi:hypothetical protein
MAKANKATAAKKSSVEDLMAAATGLATTVDKVEKKTDDRAVMPFPDPKTEELFIEFSTINNVYKDLEEHNNALKAQVNDKLFEQWKNLVWASKKIIENPALQTFKDNLKDISALFMIFCKVDSCKYDPTKDANFLKTRNPTATTIKMFESVGLNADIAKKIVEQELIFINHTYIPFDELAVGTYSKDQFTEATSEMKEVARKILTYLMSNPEDPSETGTITVEALTPDERRLAIKQTVEVKVQKGFFQRLLTYCQSRKDMDAILSIIKPVFYVGHTKLGVSDTDAVRLERKVEAVRSFFTRKEEE